MMDEGELRGFLSQPLLGRIATVNEDGSPHIATTWFLYDGENVIISTGRDSRKVRNIRRDNRVAITIDTTEGDLKHKGVIFQGRAELIEEDVLETTKKIYLKYMGSLDHPMVSQLLAMPRVLVKLGPETTISWDYAKMGGE